MTTAALAAPRPPAEPLMRDASGNPQLSWQLYFSQTADFAKTSQTGITAAQAQAVAANAAAVTAGTNAATAQAAANTANATLTALLASPPIWVIGDYRQTSLASLGSKWLLCDGSNFSTSTYPDLYSALSAITAAGTAAGTWLLPTVAPLYHSSHPAPAGPPMLNTFIRAL